MDRYTLSSGKVTFQSYRPFDRPSEHKEGHRR